MTTATYSKTEERKLNVLQLLKEQIEKAERLKQAQMQLKA
jgi:hypothetical protein